MRPMVLAIPALLLGTVATQLPAQAQAPPPVIALLDRYAAGDFDAVVEAFAAIDDVEDARKDLERHGEAWTEAEGPEAAARRRLVAATFALEFTNARMADEWSRLRPLVEWGCQLLRSGPPSEAERTWHLASVAVAQGAADWDLLRHKDARTNRGFVRARWPREDHAAHGPDRFPNDLDLQFSRTLVEAAHAMPPWPHPGGWPRSMRIENYAVLAESATTQLQFFVDVPALSGQADLWMGMLLALPLNRPDDGMVNLDRAASSPDAFVSYLAHYAAGRLYAIAGRTSAAVQRYRAALAALPRGQSASLSLASELFRLGDANDALAVMTESFNGALPRDPFKYYGFGNYWRLDGYLTTLRGQMTQ